MKEPVSEQASELQPAQQVGRPVGWELGGTGAGSCAHVAMAKTSATTMVESGVITRSILEPSSDGWVGNSLVDDALSSMMLPRETTILSRVSNVTPWLKPLHSRIFSMWDRRAAWNLFQSMICQLLVRVACRACNQAPVILVFLVVSCS